MGYNLAQGFAESAERNPEGIALHVDGVAFSYAELRSQIQSVASWIRAQTDGVAGARVAVFAKRSLDCYLGILGAAWAGATYVPVNPQLPEARLARMLASSRAQAIVVDREHQSLLTPRLRAGLPVLCPSQAGLRIEEAGAAPEDVGETHVAYLEFTSGTTGVPKGVLIPSRAVEHYLAVNRSLVDVDESDRVAALSEVAFDLSVFDMFFAWDRGAELHVVPASQAMAPCSFIRERSITVVALVPSVAVLSQRMKLLVPGAMPSLRVSVFAGEPLPAGVAEAWRAAAPNGVIENFYGPTEATVVCTRQRFEGPQTPAARGIVSIGTPFPGTKLQLLDAERRPVGANLPGELAISGAQLAVGYDGDEEKTREKFVMLDGERWYLTGDLAQRDAEGRYFHLGRIDNQVKVRGLRVELEEVEAHLREVYATDAVAAVAWPVRDGSAEGIVGFVCQEQPANAPELRKSLRARLPAYMAPTALHFVAELPLNANGKTDRKRLLEQLEGSRG